MYRIFGHEKPRLEIAVSLMKQVTIAANAGHHINV